MPGYYSNAAREKARVGPRDLPHAIGVHSESGELVGIAYPTGHVGGQVTAWSLPGHPSQYLGKPEATWRIVIGKAQVEVEGRFVLRSGEFVELAEDAS